MAGMMGTGSSAAGTLTTTYSRVTGGTSASTGTGNSAVGNTTALGAAPITSSSKPAGVSTTVSTSAPAAGSTSGGSPAAGGSPTGGSPAAGGSPTGGSPSGGGGNPSPTTQPDTNTYNDAAFSAQLNAMQQEAGGGGYYGGGSTTTPTPGADGQVQQNVYDLETNAPSAYKLPEIDGPNVDPVNHVDITELKEMLQQITDAQKQQSQQSIDYNVQTQVDALNRALDDAAIEYDTMRNQVAADEARALDNQALYAEARGDKGGIGQAQYASIQNTAAQNRRSVNQAQTKLGTDTARQISDLRAQGEFQKADQLLQLTQSYLSELMNLEQWAMSTNLSVDEFNTQLQQWEEEYRLSAQQFLTDTELAAAQLTGMFSDSTRTQAAQNELMNALATSGNALLSAGVLPNAQQLKAMGMTDDQARQYLKRMGIVV